MANPSIIFMDEPTSGLDARAAAIVMRAVRAVGNNGRTVVVTIHQPSIEIFESFDRWGQLGLVKCMTVVYSCTIRDSKHCRACQTSRSRCDAIAVLAVMHWCTAAAPSHALAAYLCIWQAAAAQMSRH